MSWLGRWEAHSGGIELAGLSQFPAPAPESRDGCTACIVHLSWLSWVGFERRFVGGNW